MLSLLAFFANTMGTPCPRTDGSQSNAAGLRREYQGDLAGIKAFFEFLRDLLHQLRIHTMVEEAIHLHNVAGKDLPPLP